MIKVVADNKIPFLKGALEGVAEVVYLPGGKISRTDLLDADALITRTRTRCDEHLLKDTPVKFIASATIGYDHIDTDWCNARGIQWTNAPGCNASSVKQYVASALAGIIDKENWKFSDITLGIVGVGNVGKKIKEMAEVLGVKVLLNDPPRERAEGKAGFRHIETVVKNADIITLHVPLNRSGSDKTWHLFNTNLLKTMKKGAWLINSSRGEVIETNALKDALAGKHLAGVVLDVWENEPEIDKELLEQSFLATPHIAGYSADGKANGTAMSVKAVSKFFALGLDRWYPENIPNAPASELTLSCQGAFTEKIFSQVSLFAYNIMQDSRMLKSSPETFEEQRGGYPIRREPLALKIKTTNEACKTVLEKLGYLIQT